MSESLETAAKIVIVLASLVVLIVFLQKTMFAGDKIIDERACRESIKTHSLLVRSGVDKAPDIECSPRSVTVRKSDDANRVLAEEMLQCWQRWEQGKIDLFVTEGTYCNVCSTLTLDNEINLADIFAMERSDGITYGDLLLPYESLQNPSKLAAQPPVAPGDVAVLFYYDKNHSTRSVWESLSENPLAVKKMVDEFGETTLVAGAIGAGAGALIGAACSYFTVGWCSPTIPYLSFQGLALGTLVGGGGGAFYKYNQGVPHPEWLAAIFVVPNDDRYYKVLGCEFTHQQGFDEQVGTAENI